MIKGISFLNPVKVEGEYLKSVPNMPSPMV